jgi:glycosyltransferase involved in cell wall biosynthesis
MIIVPSEGLRRDLIAAYPGTSPKIRVVHNPVDLEHFTKPATFSVERARAQHSLGANDVVIVFVAKAGFRRKGLIALISALAVVPNRRLKLLVVGGTEHEREEALRQVKGLGLGERVVFAGLLSDVRPTLWCGDIYAAPSTYEAFSLAALEAAAASLPLLATPVSGMEEILSPQTGWEVESTAGSIASALSAIADTPRGTIRDRGLQARRAVEIYDLANFVGGWRTCLLELASTSSDRREVPSFRRRSD